MCPVRYLTEMNLFSSTQIDGKPKPREIFLAHMRFSRANIVREIPEIGFPIIHTDFLLANKEAAKNQNRNTYVLGAIVWNVRFLNVKFHEPCSPLQSKMVKTIFLNL